LLSKPLWMRLFSWLHFYRVHCWCIANLLVSVYWFYIQLLCLKYLLDQSLWVSNYRIISTNMDNLISSFPIISLLFLFLALLIWLKFQKLYSISVMYFVKSFLYIYWQEGKNKVNIYISIIYTCTHTHICSNKKEKVSCPLRMSAMWAAMQNLGQCWLTFLSLVTLAVYYQ
jgi:hypothetical protein